MDFTSLIYPITSMGAYACGSSIHRQNSVRNFTHSTVAQWQSYQWKICLFALLISRRSFS